VQIQAYFKSFTNWRAKTLIKTVFQTEKSLQSEVTLSWRSIRIHIHLKGMLYLIKHLQN